MDCDKAAVGEKADGGEDLCYTQRKQHVRVDEDASRRIAESKRQKGWFVMYHAVEGTPRMTLNEASERYPSSYILMQKENRDTFDPVGIVLYIGDNFNELFALQVGNDIPLGVVVEGLNHTRSLGGVVIGG